MGIKLEDLPPRMQQQAREQLSASGGKTAIQNGEPKCNPHDALESGSQNAPVGKELYLVVLLYRTGQSFDLDNASIKPILDGIVEKGLVKDDSAAYIKGLVKLPFQVKTKDEERTELEFWDANYFAPYIDAARRNVIKEKSE
jgi:hypothetical protein